jgi:hypothetical protein
MPKRITVVISQSQSKNPAKSDLEGNVVAALLGSPGIDVSIIPNLYDLTPDSTGMLNLSGIEGDMVVCAWLFPRAAHWTLDRAGVRGQVGATLLKAQGETDEDDDRVDELDGEPVDDKERVITRRNVPVRKIYCLDLRSYDAAQPYVDEIRRIAAETKTQTVELGGLQNWIQGSPKPEQMERYLAGGENGAGSTPASGGPIKIEAAASGDPALANGHTVVDQTPQRRWYPVIDYGRCTNCMECIDFCLFGVYGVDGVETILVEQPDNCRKGCPACSRVCPENAIIFPQHKTPTIAGSAEVAGSLKIDLSQLFGGPDGASAEEIAARERDEQLILAGREAVGMMVGIPKRQADQRGEPRDELDGLMDKLDDLDL